MRLVGIDEVGINIRLHPKAANRIYWEVCDNGDLRLTGNFVARIDRPSWRLQGVMDGQLIYPPDFDFEKPPESQPDEVHPYYLIIETDEPPSPPPPNPYVSLQQSITEQTDPLYPLQQALKELEPKLRAQFLEQEAAQLGIKLTSPEVNPARQEREAVTPDGRIEVGKYQKLKLPVTESALTETADRKKS